MTASEPAIARLWELNSQITSIAFGPKDIFENRDEPKDFALQQEGQKFVPELTAGRYDRALSGAAEASFGAWKNPAFRSLLTNYKGPIAAKESSPAVMPQFAAGSNYRFIRYAVPTYPSLAKSARIQGRTGCVSPLNRRLAKF